MDANLTDSDKELIFILTTAIYTTLSITVVIPFLFLTVLCIAALCLAKSINLQTRTLLINIFVVDLLAWVLSANQFLGYPGRVFSKSFISCHVVSSLSVIIGMQAYTSPALYAIMVYFFVKDGVDPTKWRIIIPYIVVSWAISITLGILAYFDLFLGYRGGIDSAFCDDILNLPPSLAILIPVAAAGLLSFGVIISFSMLVRRYIKRNALQGNVQVKRSVAKILLYLFVVSIVNLFVYALLSLIPVIDTFLSSAVLPRVILHYHVLRITTALIPITLPIVILAVLRPLRQALKQVLKRVLCCCVMKNNVVYPEV